MPNFGKMKRYAIYTLNYVPLTICGWRLKRNRKGSARGGWVHGSAGMMMVGRSVAAYRAAHWDGKIETGQALSSGTYFYQLKAGDHTETRKMVILK